MLVQLALRFRKISPPTDAVRALRAAAQTGTRTQEIILTMATQSFQLTLLDVAAETSARRDESSTTFTDNMRLPVHRWFRYSAGFSAEWVHKTIVDNRHLGEITVLDPYAGSGTTLIASEQMNTESIGVDAHPFIVKIARAKLYYREDPWKFMEFSQRVVDTAATVAADTNHYPDLIHKCYSPESLAELDKLRRAWEQLNDNSPVAHLGWLALVSILRTTSVAGTAPWQYVLPNKSKKSPPHPFASYSKVVSTMSSDMVAIGRAEHPRSVLMSGDARELVDVSDGAANLVITSPPYPNNYDYADATRLEMSFFGEVGGWGDLQLAVRQYLVRSCSQHMREKTDLLAPLLDDPALAPIRDELTEVCQQLAEVRLLHGGKKNYHLMVAAYFLDMAKQWNALRRVCRTPSEVYFVIGDSAPYGVYVPVVEWNSKLATHSGFHNPRFEKTRDRNVKWKNRKHRVPLMEGRFLVSG